MKYSYFKFCSSKIFCIKEYILHPRVAKCWQEASKVECTRRNEYELFQKKLRNVLVYAAQNVPYYRRLFKARGLDLQNVNLSDFPIIEKKDIRGHENEFAAEGLVKRIRWARTSGSTGEPFCFGKTEFDYSYAVLWRGLARFGIRPGDKRALVKGVDETACVSKFVKIKRAIYGWINRCIIIDAHFLARSDVNVKNELKRILAYKPVYVHGYTSSIYLLAKQAESNHINCTTIRVRAVVTESEKCHEFQRKVIERVFHAPVVENYGSVEFGMIAQPAKDGRLCINEDHVYVETTPEGEAVFTNLDEYGFPLVRFKNGDKVTIGPVHDELPYRTLSSIDGRVAETIRLQQGGALQGYIVMYPISKHMKYLREYQVYQPDVDHLVIRIVEAEKLPAEIEDQIMREMRDIVGTEINLKIEKVESIPLTKRGKRTFVISDVKE